ncbi:MYND finger [Colletotrichum orchidophilum]|uniref:MYND finger n=1 Tax=Colletotrichum orchidophilum TaxID=1209926 RepID=A0A1G4BHS3_9PEZI|nr:MYND finger [Colletotrichum orchidophilum]OHF00827.1 MYND finger [Colletotrichum orchidophilum]
MSTARLQATPLASSSGAGSGAGRKQPESLCYQLATPANGPEEMADLLDPVVTKSKKKEPAGGIVVVTILNTSSSGCLFPLACLVHFFTSFIPRPIISFLQSDSCLEKSVKAILMEAETSAQGLFQGLKHGFYPSTGRNHLLRLLNVSGSSCKRNKNTPDAGRRGLPELDYILFQEGLPSYFERTERYDILPGDPVDYLFAALPLIEEDDAGFKGHEKSADYDRRFALAVWPYANSDVEEIIAKSKDKCASDYWWAARFAFSLWNRSDLSIRCAFTQLLGEIAASRYVEMDEKPPAIKPNHNHSAADVSPCPGTAYVQKHRWLKYTRWVYRGRKDEDADIKLRQNSKCDLGELLGKDECVVCGHRRQEPRSSTKKKPMLYCSGCYVEWFPHLRRNYCGPQCQKKDWKKHFAECQRRKHFIRAVFILKGIAEKFMATTFSGQAVDIAPTEPCGNKSIDVDRAGVPRTTITPAAYAVGPWIGEQVFPLGQSFLAEKSQEDRERALAWDAGDNIYYHLQLVIRQIISPLCDNVVEMQMFVRNANTVTSFASDRCREGPIIHTSKGKDPMFWPHPVLNCRLKGSDDLFIIDLLGAKFGFADVILPGEPWVKARLAYCVSSTVLKNMKPHWYPREQEGLISCRDEVAYLWKECIKTYISSKWPNIQGPFALSHLKEQLFRERTHSVMLYSDVIFKEATDRIRDEGIYRQFLVHDPNPYSHEFRIGVTDSQEECDLYKEIWMDRRAYDIIIKNKLSEQNQLLPPGSETLRLTALWVDRLRKYGEKNRFDSVKLLGPCIAKHYNIRAAHSSEEDREVSTAWLMHHGISKSAADKFFEQCKAIVSECINSGATTPELMLAQMAMPGGFSEYTKNMSMEDARDFASIGAFLNSHNAMKAMSQMKTEILKRVNDRG